jgi:hypothetical protein
MYLFMDNGDIKVISRQKNLHHLFGREKFEEAKEAK